jgi:drug/metabolite transporter (DMT)-like permease
VLNQLIIPITMVGASFFLNAKFESSQLWGSAFIVLGAIVASSGYLFTDNSADADATGAVTSTAAKVSTAMVSAAIVLYFISIIPSAASNLYKDGKMKEQDMNEVHTSTVVAFWQLWFGFLFLPLMSLPQLGTLRVLK